VVDVHTSTPPALRLAEEIAAQFRHRPATEAAATIAQHIRTFWDPRMRAQLAAAVKLAGEHEPCDPSPCEPSVVAAVDLLGDSPHDSRRSAPQ
jgi:formate dehydrogenase subunit delta